MSLFADKIAAEDGGELIGGMALQMAAPLLTDVQRVMASVDLDNRARLSVNATCRSGESALRVKTTLESLLVLSKNVVAQQAKTLVRSGGDVPNDGRRESMSKLVRLVQRMLDTSKVNVETNNVLLSTNVAGNTSLSLVGNAFLPALYAAREAAKRQMSINNLRQIAIAMLNYESRSRELSTTSCHWSGWQNAAQLAGRHLAVLGTAGAL